MERFDLILNHLALAPPAPDKATALQRIESLRETIHEVFAWAPLLEQRLTTTEATIQTDLAPGYTIYEWFNDESSGVNQEERLSFLGLFTSGPYVDDILMSEWTARSYPEVSYNGARDLCFELAVRRESPIVSAAPWPPDRVPVTLTNADGQSSGEVRNFHCVNAVTCQLEWLAERLLRASRGAVSIKPAYAHAVHHDPTSGQFRGGSDGMTSIIPRDAEHVYREAVMTQGNYLEWWGLGEGGHLYRYKASLISAIYQAHWTGSTDPSANEDRRIEDREVPPSIRDRFPSRRR